MANVLGPAIIDGGLGLLHTTVTKVHILSADPVVYADIATFTLGNKTWTPPAAFAAPTTGDVSGRKSMSTTITDGNVTATGTAAKWALEDGTNLLGNGSLSATQGVTAGNTFTLASFKIEVPDR